jgi:hypothetical protein
MQEVAMSSATRKQQAFYRYVRILESTARQLKLEFGIPMADAALREAQVAIRKDDPVSGRKYG